MERSAGALLSSDPAPRNDRCIRECPAGRSLADQAVGDARRFTLMHDESAQRRHDNEPAGMLTRGTSGNPLDP